MATISHSTTATRAVEQLATELEAELPAWLTVALDKEIAGCATEQATPTIDIYIAHLGEPQSQGERKVIEELKQLARWYRSSDSGTAGLLNHIAIDLYFIALAYRSE
jgi:hypothetical protein